MADIHLVDSDSPLPPELHGQAAVTAHPVRLLGRRYDRNRGPASRLSKQQRLLAAEIQQRMQSGFYPLVSGPCVCGDMRGFTIAQRDRYGLPLNTILCATCGTLRTDPYLDAASLADFYHHLYQALYARAPQPERYYEKQRRYGERLLAWATPHLPAGGAVAEIGCGAGGALSVFHDAGYRVAGCDYSRDLIEQGRDAGVPSLHVGDLETLAAPPHSAQPFDMLFLHHVFEHLADPEAMLRRTLALSATDGLIVIAVPDVGRCNQFPEKDGDLRRYLHVAHKFNFTLRGLQMLAERVGLQASLLDIEPSTASPELWVGFARRQFAMAPLIADTAIDPDILFSRLQKIEQDFIRRKGMAKLLRPLRLSLWGWFKYWRGRNAA